MSIVFTMMIAHQIILAYHAYTQYWNNIKCEHFKDPDILYGWNMGEINVDVCIGYMFNTILFFLHAFLKYTLPIGS